MFSRQSKPPVAALAALLACFVTLLVVYHWTSKPQAACTTLQTTTSKVNLALPGGTLWTRPAGGHDVHSPLSGDRPAGQTGVVDRIDIYQQVSDVPSKSTVLFAYRRSSCPDWNRENPDKLFSEPPFHVFLPKGGVFLDIGACYGDTAVPMAILADQVIAFEPNPWSFEVLKLNARMNPSLNIHPHNFAAGDGQSSELLFTYGGDMCNGGITGSWKDASKETSLKVPAVHIPSFLEKHYGAELLKKISVIKVDAEGFDAKIIKTLKPLTQHSKFVLLVEWFDYYFEADKPDGIHPGSQELFDAIKDLGMVPHDLNGNPVAGPQNKYKLPDLLCKFP